MLNRTALFALGAAVAIGAAAFVPAIASAKPGKHAHKHHHHHHHHRIVHWHRKVIPVVVGTTAIATYAATTSYCTCLTKEYLPDGTVLFKDVCTKEMAMNPPPGKQAEMAR